MSAAVHHIDRLEDPGPLRAPKLRAVAALLAVVGLATFVFLLFKDPTRAWSSLLQGMLVTTWPALGAMFFIAVHSVCNAKWIMPLRRIMEGLTTGLLLTLVTVIAIVSFGGPYLYDWINLTGDDHKALFHVTGGTKSQLMVWSRWAITSVCIVLVWIYFQMRLVNYSLDQDASNTDIRARHRRTSIGFIIFFALSITFFVWDMLLSLHVNWFSTMWGVYCFTSAVQTFLCVMCLLVVWLRRGPLKVVIQEHTVHDLGTWMVGFSCFCAYIGFSQYMLIYYANLDEETYWYVMRTQHGYGLQYAIEAFIRWPVVFLGLMSQSVRTKPWAMVTIAIIALTGNWLDWSWIIMPAFSPNEYRCPFEWQELLVGAGFAGGFLLLALRFWSRNGLIAKGEPRLLPTVNAEHLH
ncbi:MAG: hypothetical protein H0W72_03760 [Planctomycetes bacterium]|nr:hypothetical protein [Planctomycetota bacterium]